MKKLLFVMLLLNACATQHIGSLHDIHDFPEVVDMYRRSDNNPQPVFHTNRKGYQLLTEVNNYYNWTIAYEHNQKNYWQTSAETTKLKRGDCKDIAVAKWKALIDNGIPEKDMYFQVGMLNNSNEAHAVLMVRFGGEWNYLDNTTPILWEETINKKTAYMINRFGWKYGKDVN